MFFHNIKHNVIIFLCIFLIISGCQKEKEKIIVENNEIIEIESKINKTLITKNYPTNKITKKEITPNNDNVSENLKNDNVVFEFKNERLLQGRNLPNNLELKKTNKALSAVLKMFKKNLSSNSTALQLEYNDSSTGVNKYFFKTSEVSKHQNILVFLPLTGKYSNFGNKIRKALDLSILNFGQDGIKLIYFDTGTNFDQKIIISLFEKLKPRFIIGPFTREILLKIKPLAKKNSLPILTFSNDIAMVEDNVWSLGFSPEEQIESVINCALIHGYKKFGVIAPNNLYGKIITNQSKELITVNKKNYYEKIYLSNENLNNKADLYSILSRFLQFSKTQEIHTKFDTILIGGRKDFILEIAPLLAYFNVDSRYIRVLGTEKFNNNEIKNEPSLEKAWFPIISSKNEDEFKFLWNELWADDINYFANAGFDAGFLAINYLENTLDHLNNVEGPVTGLIFKTNGYVEKPIRVMQIENLGKLTNIKKCNKSMG
jgi:ABC-type branched-subunit amino acid transport system substrate-binding protein